MTKDIITASVIIFGMTMIALIAIVWVRNKE